MASASTSTSTSTSSVEKRYKYDVFLSFRGKDLRTSFVDHLYHALLKRGIKVFKDDKDIEIGKRISDELPKAIKDSKFHIVIFSKRYADSYWCLNELIDILEICQNPEEEEVTFYPIFYDVTPSEVRHQQGPVGEAFSVHSENEAAGRWKTAMKKAANLEGLELDKTGDGHEVQFIEKVVRTISQKPYFARFGVNDKLVGTEAPVEKLILSIEVGVDDVRMIGITGMGGVGKTTLASVVFSRIANQFHGKSFVDNVRERSNKDARGLQDMQQQLLTSVFCDPNIKVSSDVEGVTMMKRRLPSIKALVVLDDVNNINQLEALAEPSWFRTGSRIIITSRDKQVLVAHGVQNHNIHDISTLSDEDAIRLLSRYAFKTESPVQGYEKLSKEVLRYAAGLPLTIKTLSSSLYACSTFVWEDAIKRLETIPWDDTFKILEISYDALQKDHKDIFLYVACLLKGETKKKATRILESLGFHAQFGLGVLEQKSLITFRDGHKYYDPNDAYDDDDDDKRLLDMHDHVEEMGMHIVRSLYPDEPGRHKLLWINHEIKTIVEKDMGTKAIRGIKVFYSDLCPAKLSQSLRKMRRICFLHVGRPYYEIDEFVKAGRKYLPSSLQYLHWYGYPYRYLPKTFQADKLVVMEMPKSHIHQLWKGEEKKVLPKLRLLNLSESELETFDSAGMTPNLEELVLRECKKLIEVNICAKCSHLKKLDLYKCKALEKLTISNECPSPLKSLNLYDTKLRCLNLGLTPNLEVLSVQECEDLEELVMPVECRMLTKLSLGFTKLRTFNLGLTPNLEVLSVEYCYYLEELVMPVECRMLTKLFLTYTKLRSVNLGMTPNLEVLSVEYCNYLEELFMPVECRMLTKLSLYRNKKLRIFNLGMTPNLEVLLVGQCEYFEEFVMPVECRMLSKLSLHSINKLRSFNLGMTPNLEVLSVEYCEYFEEFVMPVECRMLTKLSLERINKLRSFNLGMTPNLEVLSVGQCEYFQELNMPVECPMLSDLSISGINKLRSLNLGLTPNLEVLKLISWQDFEEVIYVPTVELPRLRSLSVWGYKDEHYGSFSYLLEKLKSLEELRLVSGSMTRLPDDSIYMLKHHLRVLDLSDCTSLEQLLEDLDRLECLEELDLGRCICLESIPDCICNMTRLKILNLSHCYKLEKLPDEFRRLQSLQVLKVTWIADRLKNLPESISQLKHLVVWK